MFVIKISFVGCVALSLVLMDWSSEGLLLDVQPAILTRNPLAVTVPLPPADSHGYWCHLQQSNSSKKWQRVSVCTMFHINPALHGCLQTHKVSLGVSSFLSTFCLQFLVVLPNCKTISAAAAWLHAWKSIKCKKNTTLRPENFIFTESCPTVKVEPLARLICMTLKWFLEEGKMEWEAVTFVDFLWAMLRGQITFTAIWHPYVTVVSCSSPDVDWFLGC